MSDAPIVRVKYDQLHDIAAHFDHHAEEITKVYRFIADHIAELRAFYWVGDNADTFYVSMDNEVLPGILRLQQALAESAEITREIIRIFQQAEEEGAAAFNEYDDGFIALNGTRNRKLSQFLRKRPANQQINNRQDGSNSGGDDELRLQIWEIMYGDNAFDPDSDYGQYLLGFSGGELEELLENREQVRQVWLINLFNMNPVFFADWFGYIEWGLFWPPMRIVSRPHPSLSELMDFMLWFTMANEWEKFSQIDKRTLAAGAIAIFPSAFIEGMQNRNYNWDAFWTWFRDDGVGFFSDPADMGLAIERFSKGEGAAFEIGLAAIPFMSSNTARQLMRAIFPDSIPSSVARLLDSGDNLNIGRLTRVASEHTNVTPLNIITLSDKINNSQQFSRVIDQLDNNTMRRLLTEPDLLTELRITRYLDEGSLPSEEVLSYYLNAGSSYSRQLNLADTEVIPRGIHPQARVGNDDIASIPSGRRVPTPGDCTPPCIHTFPAGSSQAQQFPRGVYIDANGFPDFTPYSEVNVTVPRMNGMNDHDFPLAEDAARRAGIDLPNDYLDTYTWHHHQDGVTMQLVLKDLNNPRSGGVPHAGGASYLREYGSPLQGD